MRVGPLPKMMRKVGALVKTLLERTLGHAGAHGEQQDDRAEQALIRAERQVERERQEVQRTLALYAHERRGLERAHNKKEAGRRTGRPRAFQDQDRDDT